MADQPKREVWVRERLGAPDRLAFARYDLPAPTLGDENVRYTPALHWLKPTDIVGNYPKNGQAALIVVAEVGDPVFARWSDKYSGWLHLPSGVVRMGNVERFALLELPEGAT